METTNITNVTLATPDRRTNVVTENTVTLEDLLRQNNVNFSRASVMLDGSAMSENNMRQTLNELNAGEACTISVCVKLANA